MVRTQQFRQLALGTPLGDDVLLLKRFNGTERLGRLFEYDLELLSEVGDIPLEEVTGQNVTIRVQWSTEDQPRYINGYVSRFALARPLGKTTEYRATVVPWLWFLTRTSDCRIFQNLTVPEIIRQVLADNGFESDIEDRLQHEVYRKWDYCVQYGETDFDFISRLIEQEGIFYYFVHDNGKHTLVLANASSTHDTVGGYEKIPYVPPTSSLREREYIRQWAMEQQVQPAVYAHTDFDFTHSRTSLLAAAKAAPPPPKPDYEVYEYPGEYAQVTDGEAYARRRIEEYQARREVAQGEGEVRGVTTGRLFTLTGHPRSDQCKQYLVTSTSIEAVSDLFGAGSDAGGTGDQARNGDGAGAYVPAAGADGEANYTVRFTAIKSDRPFRPRRITPRPMIRGPQTAMVVGPKGEEIHTDKYGRVKVLFHWDRHGKADENSSCWVRVAQHWAGRKWGTMFIPRIGHEVIVEFLEGDPDRPIITGRVYNDASMPPYDPPKFPTVSTIKTLSSKGGGGFNELRFDDKKGSEQIFLHAEKDQDLRIKNDTKEWTGRDRHAIVKRDQREKVEGDKHLTVAGDRNEKVDGTISVEAGTDMQEKVGGNHALEAGSEIHVKAGTQVVIEGGSALTIQVGSSFISLKPEGIAISGAMVDINSGGSADTGAGCAPDPPAAPLEAATAEPGEVNEPPPKPKPPKPTTYSASAKVLKVAAVSGVPFCEECAAAAAAAAVAAGTAAATQEAPDAKGEPAAKEAAERKQAVGIEIKLVGEDDQPIPGERYRIKLPDGRKVEGALDQNGFASEDGFEPGTCQVCFPDLDKDAWEKI